MWQAIKNFFLLISGKHQEFPPNPGPNYPPQPMTKVQIVTPYELAVEELAKNIIEFPGSKHNPRILEYHSVTTLKATTDEVPWCASFICWCIEKSGRRSTRSAAARSYLDYGLTVELKDAQPGDIVVFKRTGGHHVAFFERWASDGNLYVLGGNQSQRVAISKYNKANLLQIRRVL